jgi:hypothetical protein
MLEVLYRVIAAQRLLALLYTTIRYYRSTGVFSEMSALYP